MKRIYGVIIFTLSLLVGCNKEPEYFELIAPADQMHLAAAQDDIVLDLAKAKQEAVRFTWSQATDRGQDTKISYKFRFYQDGNKSKSTEWVDLGAEARSVIYTHAELNSILNQWGVSPGDASSIVAELIADVVVSPTYMKPEISLFDFTATGYENNLYLFYTSGESILRILMNADVEKDGIYNWTGRLPVGSYWFSTNKNNGYPAYMKGNTTESLVYQKQEGGTPFSITKESLVDIRVDLENMKVTSAIKNID